MKCMTATLEQGGCYITRGIELPFYRDAHSIRVALDNTNSMRVHQAVHTDLHKVYVNSEDRTMILWECGLKVSSQETEIVAPDESSDTAVLLLVDADNDSTCDSNRFEVVRGYAPRRDPVTNKVACCKRLLKLEPGASAIVTVTSPSEYIMGCPVAKGVEAIARFAYNGGTVTMTVERRLAKAGFSRVHLFAERTILVAIIVMMLLLLLLVLGIGPKETNSHATAIVVFLPLYLYAGVRALVALMQNFFSLTAYKTVRQFSSDFRAGD